MDYCFRSLTRLSLSTIIVAILLSSFSFTSTEAYDALDPNGNITIKWDIISWTPDGYVAVVTMYNFQQYRHVSPPGWTLGWTWAKKEVIWSMMGAQTTEQGDCSRYKTAPPHCCKKTPTVVDLLPGTPYNQQIANCCKGGVINSWAQSPDNYASSFQVSVGAAGTTNKTVKPPKNFTLLAPGPGYTCGPGVVGKPTKFITADGRRVTQAMMTWNVTCTYSQFLAQKTPTCCVSLSSFYNETIVPCPTCTCGCQNNITHPGSCVNPNSPYLASVVNGPGKNSLTPLVQCTKHMCPIRVHWHVKLNYKEYWRVKVTITNFNYRMNYSQWNLVAQHPNFDNLTQIFSFNYKPLTPYSSINDTAMLWGVKFYNDFLNQEANRSTRLNNVDVIGSKLSNVNLRSSSPLIGATYLLNRRLYSASSGKDDVAATSASGSDVSNMSGVDGNDLIGKVKEVWESSVNVATQTSEKAKEAFIEVSPHVEKLLDANPYLRDVIVPVGGTVLGTIAAWAILPSILKRFHRLSSEGPGNFLPVGSLWGAVPYEKSFWGALELPVKALITFMAFSQIGVMVAPTTIAAQFIGPAWRAGVILSLVWFLHRWKTNVISRALVMKSVEGIDRNKLLALDKFSSVGLFVVGGMALAEASGVAVQSILTVGGIGGVATAFAARDILGNVLSGLSIQMSQPFSVGDTIKAGSVEGQVIEMGFTTTSLLSAEKFPIVVPNSLFSSQAIVNKSRAGWRAIVSKIPVQIDDFEKIPQISEEIKNMMKSNANVFLEKEQPYCYMSRVEKSFAELSLGCNLKQMSKDKLYSAEQDVLLQSVGIIKKHGATLASTWAT